MKLKHTIADYMPFTNQKSNASAKEAAGKEAVKLIKNGMTVGLGSGSTAEFFIEGLIEQARSGLSIKAVSSSKRSAKMAKDGGIEVLDMNDAGKVDITIDGADKIDGQKRMIKGGGGAHLREKIVASASREMVVVVDESKVVDQLGGFPLPLEVAKFGCKVTLRKIESQGFNAELRKNENGELYVTDNGNHIIDIHFDGPIKDPEGQDAILQNIPGVLETGFFFNLAGRVIIGNNEGKVTIVE
jgi:ribose 5-phosphate isomerase A